MGISPKSFAKEIKMNIFTAIGETLNSSVSILTTVARTAEKSVRLVETEVDVLSEEQYLRISTSKAELATVINQQQLEQQ